MNLPALIRGARASGLAALSLFFAIPCHAAPASAGPVKLVVVVSVDGLSWPRLESYRPWYEAGFKRLLAESQVETSCFYHHLNTETGPGHACDDFDAQRSGDAFLVPRDHVLMHWDPERGSGHGSHHDYDTHVPLLFWGAPFRAGEKDGPCAPYDLAPTLADVLGLELPDATGASRAPRP